MLCRRFDFVPARSASPQVAPTVFSDPATPQVRVLGPSDLQALLELRAAALAGVPEGFVRPRTVQDLESLLAGSSGVVFGVEQHGVLVASALLSTAPAGAESFPRIPAAEWPRRAVLFEGAMVHPAQRGRGFQRALLRARIRHARAAGVRWFCAGVGFSNVASCRNLLAEGFSIVGLRTFSGARVFGVLRTADAPLPADSQRLLRVPAGDPARHEAVLALGYIGTELLPDGRMLYRRAPE